MKKYMKVILATALMAGSIPVLAQDSKTSTTVTTTTTVNNDADAGTTSGDYPSMYIGARLMPVVANFKYNDMGNSTAEASGVVGWGWGAFLGFNLSDHVGLQGEVMYSPLAQKYKIADRVEEIKIDYINIPLLLRINTGYSKPVNLNFVFGPQFGYNVGSSTHTEDHGQTTDFETKVAVKSGDLGIAYGVGLDFSLGGYTKLGIGYRGVYGLIDISENSNSTTTSDYYVLDRTYTRTNAGYIGLSFGF